ncbi:MAG TPA: hypothetical protein VH414_04390 [Lichenihabitans sp.]|jgi:hypothetical protein|nr:hypothetical protein [Lichenihabitans sp.]
MGQALSVTVVSAPGSSRRREAAGASSVDAPLAGLAGSGLAERFRYWCGASGRRYLFSVFPVDGRRGLDDCPFYADSVVMAVLRQADGRRRILHAGDTGPLPEVVFGGVTLAAAVAAGANEIHLHLLASDATARAAIVADLMG